MVKLTAQQKKNLYYLVPLVVLLIGTFLFYFLSVRVKPNDKILTTSEGTALFANENPTFNVQFGEKENLDGQWVRFEAQASSDNPFSPEGKKNIFTQIANIFKPRKKTGIEMSLRGVDFSETKSDGKAQQDGEIQKVADILGTEKIETSTVLTSMGREIGKNDDDQIISKHTIVNQGVADGIDLEYQILKGLGLKEEIVINDLEAYRNSCDEGCKLPLNEFVFDLKVDDGVVLKKGWFTVEGKSSEVYYFVDGDGKYLAHFLPSYAVDYSGNKTYEVALKIEEKKIGNYEAKVTVNSDWLLDSDRAYPIRIDPSIVHDDTSDFSGGIFDKSESVSGPKIQLLAAKAPVVDANTVGLWHLDEASGSGAYLLDSSANGNNGTPAGTTYINNGKVVGARSFNGTSDYIGVPTIAVSANVTIEGWFRVRNSAIAVIASHGTTWSSPDIDWNLYLNSSGNVVFDVYRFTTSGGTDVASTTTYNDGNWHYVVATINGTIASLYVDGYFNASQTVASYVANTKNFQIGTRPARDGYYFPGSIDEVKISNVAKTALQIQNSYLDGVSKFSGAYTSSVLDLGSSMSGMTMSWLASGINTGNGETPYSTTGMVAQWNFNETSGTTAVSGGTCGTSCNGTLTNMTTTGQDAAVMTGWTANSRMWGAGAVMLDGTNDYINVPHNAALNLTATGDGSSYSGWYKCVPKSVGQNYMFNKYDNGSYNGYGLLASLSCDSLSFFYYADSSHYISIGASNLPNFSGQWIYVVATIQSTEAKIYLNGQLVSSQSGWTVGTPANITSTYALWLGYRNSSTPSYTAGVYDNFSLYSRVLSANEILSNYQAGNIEFQYRTSTDNSTWSNWTSYSDGTSDASWNTFDNSYLYSTTDTGLTYYWPLDEASGTSLVDAKGAITATATGTTVVSGKYSNGRNFNGTSSDYITVPNTIDTPLKTDSFTISGWFKANSLTNEMVILQRGIVSTASIYYGMGLYASSTALQLQRNVGTVTNQLLSYTYTFATGTWYYVAASYNDSTGASVLYINGKQVASSTLSTSDVPYHASYDLGYTIGALRRNTSDRYSSGVIDEVKVYGSVLTSTSIQSDYIQGLNALGIYQQKSGGMKLEGTNSNRLTTSLNDGLVSHWNLNEASGTSLADSIGTNTGTASGTTVTTGKYGNARSFNGSSSYVSLASGSNANITGDITVEMWLNPTSFASSGVLIHKGYQYSIRPNTSGYVAWADSSVYDYATFGYQNIGLVTGSWQHLVVTKTGGVVTMYLNGVSKFSKSFGGSLTSTSNTMLMGCYGDASVCTSYYFNGGLDEVKIYNVAKTADEVLEEYNASSTYYASYNLSSTDLSSKNTISVDVAGDKVGTYSALTWGESPFANYQPDANTVALWHLDEISGSAAYIKDGSGSNNSGTPTGTTYTSAGKLGGGRILNGSSDYIAIGSNTNLSPTSQVTVSAWIKSDSAIAAMEVIYDRINSAQGYGLFVDANGKAVFGINGSIGTAVSATRVDDQAWHYIVGRYNSGEGGTQEIRIYVDGILSGVGDYSTAISYSTEPRNQIGRMGTGNYFGGYIDEVSISNVVRTPDEIRQAYEIGSRMHNVMVDFGATLSSGNLITGSGDTSFTVDATTQGLAQMGSNLYLGDKLIVRELSGGTEYIAQGTVSAITAATGVATVSSWDSGSTFPTGGFTIKASVFKWQREYIPIKNRTIGTQVDATSLLTLRLTNTFGGRNIWIDDLRSSTGYLKTSAGETIVFASSARYVQYKTILSTWDSNVTPYISQVQVDYASSGPTIDKLMRHGMWFDSGGAKQNFWWVGTH